MLTRLAERLFLLVELRLLPGLTQRLVLVAVLIAALALSGGATVWAFEPAPGETFAQAVWWAFLHLTDPGYLGDDAGTVRRVVATTLTIFGLVVFVGLLVAVITQWLTHRIADFERGVTRVPFHHHVVVLGWSNRTVPVVRELLESRDRALQMLAERGARKLRIVILDDEVDHEMQLALRDGLGELYDPRRVLLRYGSPLRAEHLERINLGHAAAVILPAVAAEDATQVSSDAQVIKTLMAAADAVDELPEADRPLIVAELHDPSKGDIAHDVYPGPLELLATDRFLAQLLAQNIRHTGLSHVYHDLLTHADGNEVYAPAADGLVGVPFDEARRRIPEGVLLGTVGGGRRARANLCPPADSPVPEGHRLVVLCDDLTRCVAAPQSRATEMPPTATAADEALPPPPRRVLVLGWGRKVPALLHELDRALGDRCEVMVASARPAAEREAHLRRAHAAPVRLKATQIEAEFTSRPELERLAPATYDDIVIAASDWIVDPVEADARAVLAYLMLQQVLGSGPRQPDVLVELMDEASEPMLRRAAHEVIVGPSLVSHMLANVALRRELAPVFGDIFSPGGAEVSFARLEEYGLTALSTSFDPLSDAVAAHGDLLLGVAYAARAADADGGIVLNVPRSETLTLSAEDQLVVLCLAG